MPRQVLVSHRVDVNAPPLVVYEHLLSKIREPQRFVPGVTDVQILQEFGPHAVERKMRLPNGKVAHEVIGADPTTMTVVFRLCPGGPFSGFVSNTVLPPPTGDDKSCLLDFTMNWHAVDGSMSEEEAHNYQDAMASAIVAAVVQTKAVAEAKHLAP